MKRKKMETKKIIALSLVGLLILAFGTTVFAQVKKEEPKLDFKASGSLDIQSFYFKNISTTGSDGIYGPPGSTYRPGGAGFDRYVAYMNSRARLKFDAKMGKELSGTIFFEMDSSRWGETGDGRNKMGYWSADRAALEIKNVYIDFGVPYFGIPAPMTVRVGLQPLGVRPAMLVVTDGMGITAGVKIDPVTIAPLWFKALENKDYASDDVDVYGLHVIAKVDRFTLGGYGLYYNMNSYPLADGTPLYSADMWWIGAYLDGKAGPVTLNLDLVHDRGTVERRFVPGVKDVDYRGWATKLKVDYPWEKFNFGLVGMYASGSDQKKTSATGYPGSTTPYGNITTKVGSYVVPPGTEQHRNFAEGMVFYDKPYLARDPGYYTDKSDRVHRGDIGGTWMLKLYASAKLAPWYKATLQGMYIGDTTKNGNTVGTARKAPYGSANLRDDKTIGFEFGLLNEIKIYKNLSFDVGLGYLIAGDALEYWDSTRSKNVKPDNPWLIASRLMYRF
ncbi:MAG: hypothetical protein FJ115_05635 [Deltaproteobacteria bacterium]|nr:hypothetical protein [Deltaproteobacteria bacterium]MBM4347286.1 hypothetical protein [Deltaproteobacteria bacterium]